MDYIRCDSFPSKLAGVVQNIFDKSDYSDVSLICDNNKVIRAHQFILGSNSQVFREILKYNNIATHPWIYLNGVDYDILLMVVKYLYFGEVAVDSGDLTEFFKVASDFKLSLSPEISNFEDPKNEKDSNIDSINKSWNQQNYENTNFKEECKGDTRDESLPKKQEQLVDKFFKDIKKRVNVDQNGEKVRQQELKGSQCPDCGKLFSQNSSMLLHHQSSHQGIKFQCNKCDYSATQKGHLKIHVKGKHENILATCQVCGKRFLGNGNLQKHIQSIHEGTPYPCIQCDYIGKTKAHLKIHNETKHLGVRYDCQLCDHKAYHKSGLKEHIKTEHYGVRYKCDECPFKSKRHGNLKSHKQSIHLQLK